MGKEGLDLTLSAKKTAPHAINVKHSLTLLSGLCMVMATLDVSIKRLNLQSRIKCSLHVLSVDQLIYARVNGIF